MARIRETKDDWVIEGRDFNSGVAYDGEEFYVFSGRGSGDGITPRQARRLAKWINARCDKIERQADGN